MITGQEFAAQAFRATTPVLTAEESFDGALDLCSLYPERLMEPLDAVRVGEVEQARAAWGETEAAIRAVSTRRPNRMGPSPMPGPPRAEAPRAFVIGLKAAETRG